MAQELELEPSQDLMNVHDLDVGLELRSYWASTLNRAWPLPLCPSQNVASSGMSMAGGSNTLSYTLKQTKGFWLMGEGLSGHEQAHWSAADRACLPVAVHMQLEVGGAQSH